MSRGFKICLWVIGAYCLLMSPLIWEGIKNGDAALHGAPMYMGLLAGLLWRYRRQRTCIGRSEPSGDIGGLPLPRE